MTTRRRRTWLAGLALLGGSCAAVLSGSGSAFPAAGAAQAASSAGPSLTPGFSIYGSVHGLYPGSSVALKLIIVNQLTAPLTVLTVTTAVSSPRSGCAANNLTVAPFSGHLPLPAQGKATRLVRVSMAHSAPNACQGVRFTFTYSGTAVSP